MSSFKWGEAPEANAPTIAPEASNVVGAPTLAQHLYASLLMDAGTGTEIGYNPGEHGLAT